MRALPTFAVLTVVATAFAGCSDDVGGPMHFCSDGTALDVGAIPGHDQAGFDPNRHCPVHPTVTVDNVPATLAAYAKAQVSWSLRNGTYGTPGSPAHSMLNQWRISDTSGPASGPAESYGKELPGFTREHQNLPQTFTGTLSFPTAGVRYIRPYMMVRAVGLENGTDLHVWGPELQVTVTEVQPSGIVLTITHSAGGAAGNLTPERASAKIGDQVAFSNQDAVAHVFTFTDVPTGAPTPEPVTVESMATSAPILLTKPGSYKLSVDEPGSALVGDLAKTAEISVSEP